VFTISAEFPKFKKICCKVKKGLQIEYRMWLMAVMIDFDDMTDICMFMHFCERV